MKGAKSLELVSNFSFFKDIPTDFEIHVSGVGINVYKVHLCVVSSFSMKIRTLALCDPLCRIFKYPDPDYDRFFKQIIDYMYGNQIQINNSNVRFLNRAAAFLEIYPLLTKTSEYLANYSHMTGIYNVLKNAPNLSYALPEIIYAAINFDSIKDRPEMFDLPVPIYDAIFSRSEFYVDENSFYLWMSKLIEKHEGEDYEQLFSNLIMENIDAQYMHEIRKRLTHDMVGGAIWQCISKRLLCRVVPDDDLQKKHSYLTQDSSSAKPFGFQKYQTVPPASTPVMSSIPLKDNYFDFQMHHNDKLNGIFSGIYRRTGKNPCSASFVDIDGGGGQKARFLPRLLEYDDLDAWWNNYNNSTRFNKDDQWIIITFNRQEVILTGYTLSSKESSYNASQPKTWRVFGRKDNGNWVLVDEVNNCEEMNRPSARAYFRVKVPKGPFNEFKIEQLENHFKKNTSDKYEFCLNAIEFFGFVADI